MQSTPLRVANEPPRCAIDMNETFDIRYLVDCPKVIPTLARWTFDEWHKPYGIRSMDDQVEVFNNRSNRDRFPLAFVAFHQSQPVGTASLKLREMTTHTHLPHWLGAVYVTKEFRNRGIGTALVKRATTKAKELCVQTLYLHTLDKESLYLRLGWVEIEQRSYSGHEVTIMKKKLTQRAVSVGPLLRSPTDPPR